MMPTYRAIIERQVVSRETVEISAPSLREASRRLSEVIDDRKLATRRGVTIVRSHDDDPNATQDERLVQITER